MWNCALGAPDPSPALQLGCPCLRVLCEAWRFSKGGTQPEATDFPGFENDPFVPTTTEEQERPHIENREMWGTHVVLSSLLQIQGQMRATRLSAGIAKFPRMWQAGLMAKSKLTAREKSRQERERAKSLADRTRQLMRKAAHLQQRAQQEDIRQAATGIAKQDNEVK
jgi:hypothetical protein